MQKDQTKVFVVDDDGPARESIALLLRAMGCDVRGFPSARECLDVLSSDIPDCIVSDVNMPEIDGIAFARSVMRNTRRVPVILMTGNTVTSSLVQQATAAGAERVMEKPFSEEELESAVRTAIAPVH